MFIRLRASACTGILNVWLHRKYDIVPLLTDIAKAAVKEKVIRVIIATFKVNRILPVPICVS